MLTLTANEHDLLNRVKEAETEYERKKTMRETESISINEIEAKEKKERIFNR